MPITTKRGSIFDSKAQVLVCPVNCVGVMGKGLAKEFDKKFPEFGIDYRRFCKSGHAKPGKTVWIRGLYAAFTKDNWRNPSRIEWVADCLRGFEGRAYSDRLTSIAIPQLGCGCGGLDWADVEPLYEKHLGGLDCDVEVWIYE